MATVDTAHDSHHAVDGHQHGHHEHAPFIAHHFDNAEQQFDSGKLGIWVFLVTEVLFFSGLFVAYTLWRNHHPEIFKQAHVFLDKNLGGINTVVLLFSSLTMAWGVRSAQLGRNKSVAVMTLITMVCAALFLGVKAIEYSHKWDMGILPASLWAYTGGHAEPTLPLAKALGVSDYLVWLSVGPTILLVVFAGFSAFLRLTNKVLWSNLFLGLAITVMGYFLGVVGGHFYMKAIEDHDSHAVAAAGHADQEHSAGEHSGTAATHAGETSPAAGHSAVAADAGHAAEAHGGGAHALPKPEDLSQDVGIFFSIYYCMTGLHAFHILGGIAFLSWIYYRSLAGHWRPDYFGPVDYVGLYWHLVDLIWIYLFPMLYLID